MMEGGAVKKELGIAFCGLACCLCSENGACAGCRSGGCMDKETCQNLRCCRERGYEGCWACPEFPCKGTILDKPRIRAFARFAGAYRQDGLMAALEAGEDRGMAYHYPGGLAGDYDRPQTEEGVYQLLMELAEIH